MTPSSRVSAAAPTLRPRALKNSWGGRWSAPLGRYATLATPLPTMDWDVRALCLNAALTGAVYAVVTPRPPPTLVADVCGDWVAGLAGRLDLFIVVHFAGMAYSSWFLGDPCIAYGFGVAIEVFEANMRVVLPTLDECWYDTWLLDLLGANLLGVLAGAALAGRRTAYSRLGFWKMWAAFVVYVAIVFHDFCWGHYVFGGALWRSLAAAIWIGRVAYLIAVLRAGLRGDGRRAARATALAGGFLAADVAAHAAWGTYGKLPHGLAAAAARVVAGEAVLAAAWAMAYDRYG